MCKNIEPIRVLFVSHISHIYGGAENSLLMLLKNIDRKRFDPVVIIPGPGSLEEELTRLCIKTYKIKYSQWVSNRVDSINFMYCLILELLALPIFIYIIKKEKIQIVYTNTMVIFSGAISSHITRTPHIWHVREIIKNNPVFRFFFSDTMLLNFIMKFSTKIIAVSQAVASQFPENNFDKIKVVSNAVDFHIFEEKTPFPYINGINSEDYLAVVIGTLSEQKAQDYAIRAIKEVNSKVPNIKLLLIGKDTNNYQKKLETLVSDLVLYDKVFFIGYRNDIPQILPYCKVLLVPSLAEGFGRATIEAMASKVPVIGTNDGGTKEILQDGINGYLVSPEDPTEMAERIVKLYYNPDIVEKFVNNGKKLVLEKYTIERYAQNIEKIILEVMPNRG